MVLTSRERVVLKPAQCSLPCSESTLNKSRPTLLGDAPIEVLSLLAGAKGRSIVNTLASPTRRDAITEKRRYY